MGPLLLAVSPAGPRRSYSITVLQGGMLGGDSPLSPAPRTTGQSVELRRSAVDGPRVYDIYRCNGEVGQHLSCYFSDCKAPAALHDVETSGDLIRANSDSLSFLRVSCEY